MKNFKEQLTDSINWGKVIHELGDKTSDFTLQDIKRVLKSLYPNLVIRQESHLSGTWNTIYGSIQEYTKTCMVCGIKHYQISSTSHVLRILGYREKPKKQRRVVLQEEEIKVVTPETPQKKQPSEIIKELGMFKRGYSGLEISAVLLAVFLKHNTKKLRGNILTKEVTNLGFSRTNLSQTVNTVTKTLFKELGYYTLEITLGPKSTWTLVGEKDVFDTLVDLKNLYEELSGDKTKLSYLDSYVFDEKEQQSTVGSKTPAGPTIEEKIEEIKKVQSKKQPRLDNDQTRWKKWLLLQALRARSGAMTKISNIVLWIKDQRYEEISEDEALKLYRELIEDYPTSISLHSGPSISISESGKGRIYEAYNPEKLTELIYLWVRLTPEEVKNSFPELEFRVEEVLEGGRYMYGVTINHSYKAEIAMKNLLRIIRISGKLYTTELPIIKRTIKVFDIEEGKKASDEVLLKSFEKF